MATRTVDLRDLDFQLTFLTPPKDQGQIVEVSYADLSDGTVLRRTIDRSDRSETYAIADLSDDEIGPVGLNGRPRVDDNWESVEISAAEVL